MFFDIVTIFPDLLTSVLDESILRRARKTGKITIEFTNIRDFATDKHAMTDDRPFGGGEGMVMKADVLAAAVKHCQKRTATPRVVLLTPQGEKYDQSKAFEFSREDHLILVCGRYEGVDERFCDHYVSDQISIGDYILTGGELAAAVVIDSVTRLLPGVLGCSGSAKNDSYSRNLLKHPQFTRPRTFESVDVPEILLSGDHGKIAEYRFVESVKRTLARRPELIAKETFSPAEVRLLTKDNVFDSIKKVKQTYSH